MILMTLLLLIQKKHHKLHSKHSAVDIFSMNSGAQFLMMTLWRHIYMVLQLHVLMELKEGSILEYLHILLIIQRSASIQLSIIYLA